MTGPGQGAEARRGALGQLRVSGRHLLTRSPGTATRLGAMPHHPVAAWSHAGPESQRLKEGPWFSACSYHFLLWATWNLRLLIAPYRQGEGAGEFHMG